MGEELVLIDGANHAFRAFYALPPISTSSGFPTGALFGFAGMLWDLVFQDDPPSHAAIAFDTPGPTFRKQRYPPYKAQRKPVPPELIQQLPHIRRLAEAFGVAYLEKEGFEADDIIATIVQRAVQEGLPVRIISTDKDLMQLVADRVVTEDTISGAVYDRAGVIRKWGVPPERLRDLLALQGDSSDNIPGVPGIGPKKAKALLDVFHTVPDMLKQIDRIDNARIRELVRKHAEDVVLSYELVTLHTQVPIPVDLDAMRIAPPDPDRCIPIFEEFEFRRFVQQIEIERNRLNTAPIVTADGHEVLEQLAADVAGAREVAIETVVPPTPGALTVAIAVDATRVWRIDISPDRPDTPAATWLRAFLADPAAGKVGHDVKANMANLARVGLSLANVAGDTMVAGYLEQSSRSTYAFWDLLEEVTNKGRPRTRRADEPLQVAAHLLDVHTRLASRLDEDGMTDLYRRIELPLIPVLHLMERTGIRVDVERLRAYSEELAGALERSEKRIQELAGEPVNPSSPKQLQKVLFDKLKLRVVKKTKTGPSTDQSVLEVLAAEHPLPGEILAYRSIAKLKNTYVDPLPELVDPETSRIHTSFNQTVTSTGRLSSSDPNLQNIPVREEEGRRIRRAFVAAPGYLLLSADYSQIELRLLAHFCGDETLLGAFESGLDVHAATAAELFGVPVGLVTPQMRRSAKAINFGILYGMGAFRLARDLRIPRKEAQRHIDRYFERYGRVRAYLDETLESGRKKGYVSTLFNRRRYLPDLNASNRTARQAAERMAINMPIQGSAADIIKLAMIKTQEQLDREGSSARLLLQVHDELVLEVPERELDRTAELVKESMENVVELKCRLVVDIGHGTNWAEAH